MNEQKNLKFSMKYKKELEFFKTLSNVLGRLEFTARKPPRRLDMANNASYLGFWENITN